MSCELPEALEEHERKARKEHICCECLETIPAGTTYRYSSGVWDRTPNSYKTCARCCKVRDLAYKRAYEVDEGPPFGHLIEEIRNEYGYHGDTTLEGLTTPSQIIDKAHELWLAERRRP